MITLRQIKHNPFVWDREYFKAIKEFLWAFKWDIEEILLSREIMFKQWIELSEDKRLLDKELWGRYQWRYLFGVQFKVDGLLKEFYWEEEITMMLPKLQKSTNVIKVDPDTILRYFIKELVKGWYISDKYYLIIAPLLRSIPMGYNTNTKRLWFLEEDVIDTRRNAHYLWMGWGKQWAMQVFNSNISLEQILEKEVELWLTNKVVGDPNRWFAYWHTLRRVCQYRLLQWSRKIVMNWNKINVVAASKGSGKSFFAAELCSLELFKEKKWFWGRKKRQIKYFVPDLATVGSDVMDYMEWFLIEFTRRKMSEVTWDQTDQRPIIKINKSKNQITCNLTNTEFKMISLHGYKDWNSIGEWLSADFAVIDEAAYIDSAFWAMFAQRAIMETESMLVITTISANTPKDHWFYKLLVDGELWDDLISSHRVDVLQKKELLEANYLNNIEVVDKQTMSIEERELMDKEINKQMEFTLSSLRDRWEKEFYSRAFCVLLDEMHVFNVTGNITPPIPQASSDDYYLIATDFWGNADPAGILVVNLTKRLVVETRNIKWVPYLEQLDISRELKQKYPKSYTVWDGTTIGKVIHQEDQKSAEPIIDYWIQFTGTGDRSFNTKNGTYVVSKETLVRQTALMLDKWILNISSDLVELITQLKNFVKLTWTNAKTAKYQGKGKSHDDLVDALMMICFIITIQLWLTTREEWESFWVGLDYQTDSGYYEDTDDSIYYSNSTNVY